MAAVTLGELGRADLTTWNDARLRVWCRMIPLILLSAIPQTKRPDLTDLPGKAGGYSTDEIEAAAGWMATAQATLNTPSMRQKFIGFVCTKKPTKIVQPDLKRLS